MKNLRVLVRYYGKVAKKFCMPTPQLTSAYGYKRKSSCPKSKSALPPGTDVPDGVAVGPVLPSRPGEFHPEPLTEPDVILSHHPAHAIA